jgi:iron(III) transport system substrate-binding protein
MLPSLRAIMFVLPTFFTASSMPAFAQDKTVNVYTYREPQLITPLFERFTSETGIRVNAIFAKDGLEQKIKAEGRNSPADVLISTDVSRLKEAVDLGIAQAIKSEVLEKRIPATLRDPDGYWYALSMRARVVYVDRKSSDLTALTYEDLASPRFKGKICIRSGQHIYNNALFASAIVHMGEEKATEWLSGIKSNLAKKPSGGDRDVAKDIAAGQCQIGLGNTYYVGQMIENPDQKAWADAIKVVMPKFKNGGTHVNVSGAVLVANAPNRDNAVRLIEWLTGRDAQSYYASTNFEYPVVADVEVSKTVAEWGKLDMDTVSLAQIADKKKMSAELVDRIAFDEGP